MSGKGYMLRHLETYFLAVIRGQKKGPFSVIVRFLLYILSWPFQILVICRNWAFDRGWLSRYHPPVPVVISIGNIVVGGTGKTPVTLMIAQEFYNDFLIAILSRGYRSQAEKLSTPIVLSKGEGPIQPASYCGDEPYLLAQNLPKALVFVGRNRHKASDMAARAGAQLILLDDAMQHRRLARDFEVVVMDACDPFGQGYFLPRGLLREGKRSLSRADLIVLNHVPDHDSFLKMKQEMMKYSSACVVGTRMEVMLARDLSGGHEVALQGKKAGIFCGIAHPEYFYNTVVQQGVEVVGSVFAADHLSLESRTLAEFAKRSKEQGAEILLCTEKDRVKIDGNTELALPIVWIQMRLALVEGDRDWATFIGKAKSDLKRRI